MSEKQRPQCVMAMSMSVGRKALGGKGRWVRGEVGEVAR